jgi:hypothetical protein
VNGSSLNNGASILKWADFGSISQLWYFTDAGAGWTYIVNRNSHKDLSVNVINNTNGDPLIQWDWYNGATIQYWKFVGDGNKNYRMVDYSGYVATVGGTTGYNLVRWTSDTNLNKTVQPA